MRARVLVRLSCTLVIACLPTISLGQEPMRLSDCGARAAVDHAVQRQIVYDLTQVVPAWNVRTSLASNTESSRLLELSSEGLRVFVGVSYMEGADDAARGLKCRLQMISMPKYRPVAGIGDEAFVLTDYHLLVRTGRLLLHVQSFDLSLDTEKAIATRVMASIRSVHSDTAVPLVPSIGARVRIRSTQLGPGWRVGMFNQTRQVPPCYVVLLYDPGAQRRITMTVPARAVSRLELSRLYPGSPADPDQGAAAYDGETWVNVPLDSIVNTGRACPDSIPRNPR